ncbi:hypothetical protein ElyMa_006479500 [Elysia marginata]|uniref:DOMON domain-containing protein n=1 Tax=Elysia marginata TaxID=1093978 RepID=A0AAV4I2T6_9GAST|nr:hypothetical protein ElyMa_006479500 [Elysia marginata]
MEARGEKGRQSVADFSIDIRQFRIEKLNAELITPTVIISLRGLGWYDDWVLVGNVDRDDDNVMAMEAGRTILSVAFSPLPTSVNLTPGSNCIGACDWLIT